MSKIAQAQWIATMLVDLDAQLAAAGFPPITNTHPIYEDGLELRLKRMIGELLELRGRVTSDAQLAAAGLDRLRAELKDVRAERDQLAAHLDNAEARIRAFPHDNAEELKRARLQRDSAEATLTSTCKDRDAARSALVDERRVLNARIHELEKYRDAVHEYRAACSKLGELTRFGG